MVIVVQDSPKIQARSSLCCDEGGGGERAGGGGKKERKMEKEQEIIPALELGGPGVLQCTVKGTAAGEL